MLVRLQLLEPDKHPHLFKCLYGILMILPQSSAFITLQTRLHSVSPMILFHSSQLQASAGPSLMSKRFVSFLKYRSKSHLSSQECIKWNEL